MNVTVSTSSCRDPDANIHIFMITVVMVGSIIGNSIICLLLVRFKTLRTVPNILVVNLSVVDILNAVTNMPLMILWYICKVPYLKGRRTSWLIVSWYVLFMYLTVFNPHCTHDGSLWSHCARLSLPFVEDPQQGDSSSCVCVASSSCLYVWYVHIWGLKSISATLQCWCIGFTIWKHSEGISSFQVIWYRSPLCFYWEELSGIQCIATAGVSSRSIPG